MNDIKMDFNTIRNLLGSQADDLLNHKCTGIPKEMIHAPGPDYIDRVFEHTDRNNLVLVNKANKISKEDLLKTLLDKELIGDESSFNYNMGYLVKACG
ncbi:unnamed protein product [marine sediment metagenome]|uniref:Uncharacterized protein n=1 Tax=marine sediment metagenome TaxID=412755 RepID=X1GEQ0_9ZZZZ